MIFSHDLERKALSGVLQHPELWPDVSCILKEDDFYSEETSVHKSIFLLCKHALNNKQVLDEVLLIDRLKQLKISFPDSIDLENYVRNLFFFKVSEESFLTSLKELKKYSVRRELLSAATKISTIVKKTDPLETYENIISSTDKVYNDTVKKFESSGRGFYNLFSDIENIVEERGNNPVDSFGLMGPHPTINKIYGSLLMPGNITVICARTGVGKTCFALDYTTKVSEHYNVPVLHFDNGEMSEEELAFRQVSAMSGIPLWLIQTGKWRNSSFGDLSPSQVVYKIRSVWPKLKKMRFFYENVAGSTAEEMCQLLERFYYSEIGRGNELIFSFDYIKSDFSNSNNNTGGWEKVARMIDLFKQTIHRKLVFDKKPVISMFTSVQANRTGIVTNRDPSQIVEDEGVVGLSDAISQFCSHLFLLRRKVISELSEHGENFGTHKLVSLKNRHLGRDTDGALVPVEMPDGTKRQNFINLEIKNFGVRDKGDLRDIVRSMDNGSIRIEQNESEGLPESLR